MGSVSPLEMRGLHCILTPLMSGCVWIKKAHFSVYGYDKKGMPQTFDLYYSRWTADNAHFLGHDGTMKKNTFLLYWPLNTIHKEPVRRRGLHIIEPSYNIASVNRCVFYRYIASHPLISSVCIMQRQASTQGHKLSIYVHWMTWYTCSLK